MPRCPGAEDILFLSTRAHFFPSPCPKVVPAARTRNKPFPIFPWQLVCGQRLTISPKPLKDFPPDFDRPSWRSVYQLRCLSAATNHALSSVACGRWATTPKKEFIWCCFPPRPQASAGSCQLPVLLPLASADLPPAFTKADASPGEEDLSENGKQKYLSFRRSARRQV